VRTQRNLIKIAPGLWYEKQNFKIKEFQVLVLTLI